MDTKLAEKQTIFSLAIGAISDRVRQELSDAGVSQDVSSSVLRHLSEASPLKQLFNGLVTKNRRSDFYRPDWQSLNILFTTSWCHFTRTPHSISLP